MSWFQSVDIFSMGTAIIHVFGWDACLTEHWGSFYCTVSCLARHPTQTPPLTHSSFLSMPQRCRSMRPRRRWGTWRNRSVANPWAPLMLGSSIRASGTTRTSWTGRGRSTTTPRPGYPNCRSSTTSEFIVSPDLFLIVHTHTASRPLPDPIISYLGLCYRPQCSDLVPNQLCIWDYAIDRGIFGSISSLAQIFRCLASLGLSLKSCKANQSMVDREMIA